MVAVQVIVFSVPMWAASDHSGRAAHDSRHRGAFTIAYAVALLVVVVRPARARAMLPVVAVLAGALVITAAVDLANGSIPLAGAARHLPDLLSVGLIWTLARPPRDPDGGAAKPTGHRVLRVVGDVDR